MREPSIFRGIAVSLLRPVIGSNVQTDVVALNWFAHVRKQFAAVVQIFHFKFNSIYWKFDFYSHHQALASLGNPSTNVFLEDNASFPLILLIFYTFPTHYFRSRRLFQFSHRRLVHRCPLVNNSLKTVPKTSQFGILSPNGSSDSISCVVFNTFRFQSTHFMVTKTINLRGISNYSRQNYLRAKLVSQVQRIQTSIRRGLISLQFHLS